MPDASSEKVLSPREIAEKWTVAAQKLPFEASKSIAAAATTWTTFLTGALGALTVGGLAFLPSELGKLEGAQQEWATLFLLAALATGMVSRYLATLATQVVPAVTYTDGETLRNETEVSNREAAKRLVQSQQAATVAIAFLLLGALTTFAFPSQKPFYLVHQEGKSLCGKLVKDATGVLYIDAATPDTQLTGVTEMTKVTSCPEGP